MKTKYMSRKFIVAVVGLLLSIVGVIYANSVAIVGGCIIATCFVIGEAVIDAVASVKQSRKVEITEYVNRDVPVGEKDGGKDKA